ncbi:MAG TPA: formylmethanofuran dehydrogenase subunit B [Burkholderiales bacterium]|nr:formylmethanofuran dehydrogenase subunit B [Burkholderiales bacterium]
MMQKTSSAVRDEVPCPFCGLACDDLRIDVRRLDVLANGCELSRASFALFNTPKTAAPRIAGKTATLAETAAEAARLLRPSRQPLFGGLGTDVAGMRALLQLADRCGAVVDHMDSAFLMRNVLALQDSGWLTTTLSEIKNRADLLILAGTDVVSRFPRFFERYVWNRDSLFEHGKREIVYLGRGLNVQAGVSPDGRKPEVIDCDVARLGEFAGALRALVAGKTLQAGKIADVPPVELQKLASRMQNARYGVLVWSAADFDFPHAELAVQSLCELIKDLNRATRFSGFPLGGNEGGMTASQVCAWQSGYPARIGFGSGHPEYDPHHFSAPRMLETGEADFLLWVSSFNSKRVPPASQAPTVVLGCNGMVFKKEPDVYIPVATPGIDHAGHIYRTDNVVALRLRKLRQSALSSVAEVVTAIEKAV